MARKRFLNKVDPVFLILDRIVFDPLFSPPKKGVPGQYEILEYADLDFLVENLLKHRAILWVNILLVLYLVLHGLPLIFNAGDQALVVTGLLAPAMITGSAWYTLTFGGISEKFLGTAMTLTRWMFLAFSLSMTLLVALLCFLTPVVINVTLVLIYIGLYVSSVLYDNVDGLKIGLDTTMLRFSRASLNYYQKHGFLTQEETQSDMFDVTKAASSEQIALFTHHSTMLEHNLHQLEEGRNLKIANHLIASCTHQLFRVLEIPYPEGEEIDKGDQYEAYISSAHNMEQDTVDEATIHYLSIATDELKKILGGDATMNAKNELLIAETMLEQFRDMREIAKCDDKSISVPQELADHLFIQVFQQLLSLIKAHRHLFFKRAPSM